MPNLEQQLYVEPVHKSTIYMNTLPSYVIIPVNQLEKGSHDLTNQTRDHDKPKMHFAFN